MNQTVLHSTVFFTAYGPPGPLNYAAFFFTFLLFFITIFANISLMLVIYLESHLHKPMYIFLFNLAVNGLIGCLSVCPKIMDNLVNDIKDISHKGCLLQVFFSSVYATCAYVILAVMAYDRYVSICKPLQYHSIMTPSKVKMLVALVYFIPITMLAFQIFITSRLPVCSYNINKLFCDNLAVVKLSCVESALSNLYGICMIASLVVLPFVLVVLSYIKILLVCLKVSKESRTKAFNTCAPHLITFINFSTAILFSVIYNRHSTVSKEVNVLISVQSILFPPLVHPIIYGIRTKEIRTCITKMIRTRIFPNSLDFPHLKSERKLVPIMTLDGTAAGQGLPV
ncbi:odorant receptor, family 60, subfamily A, member 1 [Oncorhynchus nerka]|uniref:odorant receptor, family 60, subfamily A, member 1 n=1 Tax=Oncorhynchus nerka TaxID=8023 RepID=UPI0031B8961D